MANDYIHLTRKGVLAVEIEETEGDVETFVDADFNHFVSNLKPSTNIAKHMREGTTGDLGTLPAVIGTKQATISFTCELKGSGVTATTDPELHDMIMGCGRQQETLLQITIGAVTGGPFLDGETITGTTSGATGVVFEATADGTTTLRFVSTAGSFISSETITGYTSGATATSGSAVSAAALQKITIGAITGGPLQINETVTGTTSGATGTVWQTTTTGVTTLFYTAVSGTLVTGEVITGGTSGATATTASAAAAATLQKISIGAITGGPFTYGEGITGEVNGTTATGVVAKETATGEAVLYFSAVADTFASSELITGDDSGATTTSSSAVSAASVMKISIGAITGGPLEDGEVITGTTSGATGVVFRDTATGLTPLYFTVTAGEFITGEVITGTDSEATATSSAAATDRGLLYRPDSDGGPSVSLGAFYVYDTTNEYATAVILAGARGTMEIVASDVDDPVLINFSFTGKISSFANATTVQPSPTYDPYPPLPFLGATLSAFGYEPVMSSCSVNTNNTITPRKSAAAAEGILSHYISKRDPRGRCNPEMTRMADWNPYSTMTNVTDGSVGFELDGGAGRTVEVHCPHCNIEDLGIDEVDGVVHWAPEFGCHKTSTAGFTDRDIMLVFG